MTKLCRDLQLPVLNKEHSRVLTDLVHYVTEQSCRNEWLDLVDAENGYIMALSRLLSEQRKEARDANKAI